MKNSLKEFATGFNSLLVGMRVTIRQFFRPTVTVHYPYETLNIPPRFRGHIELVRDPSTGRAVCFACKLCERACPSDCISVEGAKLEGAKKRSVSKYILDFTKCSLCGSCVEACRDGAIRFSRDYNLAGTNKEDYVMDLFKRLENERLAAERAEGKVAQPSPPAGAVVGQASPPASSPGVPPGISPAATPPPKPAEPTAPKVEQPKPESPKLEVK